MNNEEIFKKLKELTTIINPDEFDLCVRGLEDRYTDFIIKYAFFNLIAIMFGHLDEKNMRKELNEIVNKFGDEARSTISKHMGADLKDIKSIGLTENFMEQRRQTIEKALKKFLKDKKEEMMQFIIEFIKIRKRRSGKQ